MEGCAEVSKGFAGVIAAILLLVAVCHCLLFTCNAIYMLKIEELHADISVERSKTRKQQAEYDLLVKEWPLLQAELLVTIPQAELANQRIEMLRTERRLLRRRIDSDRLTIAEMEITDFSSQERLLVVLEDRYAALQDQISKRRSVPD